MVKKTSYRCSFPFSLLVSVWRWHVIGLFPAMESFPFSVISTTFFRGCITLLFTPSLYWSNTVHCQTSWGNKQVPDGLTNKDRLTNKKIPPLYSDKDFKIPSFPLSLCFSRNMLLYLLKDLSILKHRFHWNKISSTAVTNVLVSHMSSWR